MPRAHEGSLLMLLCIAAVTAGGCGGEASGPSSQASVRSILVGALRTAAVPGTTVQFIATALDSLGQAISGVSFEWRSSETSIASVDIDGLVTAVRPGTVQITARANAVESGSFFEVLEFVGSIALTGVRAPVVPAAAFRLPFQVQSETGAPLDSTNRAFAWSSSSPSVADVDGSGLITALAPGSTTIILTAAVEAVSTSIPLEVSFLTYRTVQEGGAYTCGLTTGGRVYCWGDDYSGSLADGTYVRDPVPWPLATDVLFDSLSVGVEHACGLTSAGQPYCWGYNLYGALGDGTTAFRFTPLPVEGDLTLSSIVAGGRYTCGLDPAGAAYCWGWNQWGNLGVGDREVSVAPRPAAVGLQLATISLSTTGVSTGPHTCGMTIAGEAHCWGSNEWGQLATYPRAQIVELPTPVQSPSALGGHREWRRARLRAHRRRNGAVLGK